MLRALGVRDPRVLPSVDPSAVVPVVNFGNLSAFSPEVIEARTVMNGSVTVPAGDFFVASMLSVAPGGTVIEAVNFTINAPVFVNMAPADPLGGVGVAMTPLSVGGQRTVNIFRNMAAPAVGVGPLGIALGGTQSSDRVWADSTQGGMLNSLWVPPGWWFWLNISTGAAPYFVGWAWRSREIPVVQGPA